MMDRLTMKNSEMLIRGQNIKVSDVLRWLGDGMSEERIMQDHPGLEHEIFGGLPSCGFHHRHETCGGTDGGDS